MISHDEVCAFIDYLKEDYCVKIVGNISDSSLTNIREHLPVAGASWYTCYLWDSINSTVCQWGFNENNQIEDGYLVFSGVVSYEMNPQGIFVNDFICEYFIENAYNDEEGIIYVFVFEIGYAKTISDRGSMTIKIEARDLWIEDPKIPAE